jgi:hypothetical protein
MGTRDFGEQTMSQRCDTCGAALTPEDYRVPSCRFCGSAHKHHRDAAEKVLQVQAVMQNMMGAHGLAPTPPAPPYPFVQTPMSPPMHMGYPQQSRRTGALWFGVAVGLLFLMGGGFVLMMMRR